jgi:type I restriction enzyme S subunit
MDTWKNIENQQTLGELVELVDNRNSEDKVKKLLGINVNKVFMPSKANVTESNLSKYKIIKKRQHPGCFYRLFDC